MADEIIPFWKRKAQEKATQTRRDKRSLRDDIDAVLASMAGDSLGRQAWLRQFALGNGEDRRALLQARVRLEPTELRGEFDHQLTVKIVKQVGGRVIEIDGGPTGNFGRPPRDAVTGERLAAPLPDAVPAVEPSDA